MSRGADLRLEAWLAARPDVRSARAREGGVELHYTDGRVVLASRSPDGATWVDVREPGAPTRRLGPLAPRSLFGTFGAPQADRKREPGQVCAPTSGTLTRLLVREGESVAPGQLLGVIELMKMEIELRADIGGRVAECRVAAGQSVERDTSLLRIVPAD